MEQIKDIFSRVLARSTPPPPITPTWLERAREFTAQKDAEDLAAARCKVCRDAGIVHPVTMEDKPDYSAVMPCRACASPERVKKFLNVSSLDATFDNFKPVLGGAEALAAAKALASFGTTWKLLLIYGTWGCGKTHLLEAIALSLWQRGMAVRVQTFPHWMDTLKSTFDRHEGGMPTASDVIEEIGKRQFLLLDDVGSAGSLTDFSLKMLERIMLDRYRNNLFTVMTTNLDTKQLPPFIVSRFSDAEKGRFILNAAADYRPKKGRV